MRRRYFNQGSAKDDYSSLDVEVSKDEMKVELSIACGGDTLDVVLNGAQVENLIVLIGCVAKNSSPVREWEDLY